MDKTTNSISGTRFLFIVAAIVVIIAGINLIQSIVVLFLVSVFLALLGSQPVLWLKKKHIRSGFAVLIVMAEKIKSVLLI